MAKTWSSWTAHHNWPYIPRTCSFLPTIGHIKHDDWWSTRHWVCQRELMKIQFGLAILFSEAFKPGACSKIVLVVGLREDHKPTAGAIFFKVIMSWPKVSSLSFRSWSLPWTNRPNTQLKRMLRYSPIQCTYLEPSPAHCSDHRRNGIDLEREN